MSLKSKSKIPELFSFKPIPDIFVTLPGAFILLLYKEMLNINLIVLNLELLARLGREFHRNLKIIFMISNISS